ncbi:MAG: hypothetical protein ACRC5M_06785 [Anaeroplasmataceae bacterium]
MKYTQSVVYYDIQMKMIIPNYEVIDIPIVNKVVKHSFFNSNFMPVYECECIVDAKHMTKIRSNQDLLFVTMTITMESKPSDQADTSNNTRSRIILSEYTFAAFFAPNSFSPFMGSDLDISPLLEPTVKTAFTGRNLKMALYPMTGLNGNKKLLNFIGDECDVGTMIKFLIEKCNFEGYIIDKPDNENVYKDLVIPPRSIKGALFEMQTRYGVYRNGIRIFYDPPVLYVLNKYATSHDTTADKNNIVHFNAYIANPSKNSGNATMLTASSKSDMMTTGYIFNATITPLNDDVSLSEIIGDKLTFSNITLSTNMVNMKDGEVDSISSPTVTLDSDIVSHAMSGMKQVVDYDELNNPYNMSAFIKSANLGTLITISKLHGMSEEDFKPNTIIKLTIKDDDIRANEYNGLYSIVMCSIIYTKTKQDDSIMGTTIEGLVLSKMD